MKIHAFLLLFCLCLTSIAKAEQCTWVDDSEAKKLYSEIYNIGESLQDWDTNCKATDPSYEYMKKCWCDVNKASLAKLRAALEDSRKKYPNLTDKKVCFKTDNLTSINVFMTSYDTFVKRCE